MITERKHKIVDFLGEKITFHERDAYDVMLDVEFNIARKMKLNPKEMLFKLATVIEAGTKHTYANLPYFKRLALRKKLRASNLLKSLSQSELIKYANIVYELEGIEVKKKVKKKQRRNSTNS